MLFISMQFEIIFSPTLSNVLIKLSICTQRYGLCAYLKCNRLLAFVFKTIEIFSLRIQTKTKFRFKSLHRSLVIEKWQVDVQRKKKLNTLSNQKYWLWMLNIKILYSLLKWHNMWCVQIHKLSHLKAFIIENFQLSLLQLRKDVEKKTQTTNTEKFLHTRTSFITIKFYFKKNTEQILHTHGIDLSGVAKIFLSTCELFSYNNGS